MLGRAFLQNCSAQGDLAISGLGAIFKQHGHPMIARWPHAEWLLRAGRYGHLEVWFLLLEARIHRAGSLAPRRVGPPQNLPTIATAYSSISYRTFLFGTAELSNEYGRSPYPI